MFGPSFEWEAIRYSKENRPLVVIRVKETHEYIAEVWSTGPSPEEEREMMLRVTGLLHLKRQHAALWAVAGGPPDEDEELF